MTNTAMNNKLRTAEPMNHNHIKNAAKKNGYKFQRYTECPACSEELELAKQAVGYTSDTPVWANAKTALRFTKKGKPALVACPCGHRHTEKIKFKEYPTCKVRGCTHTITKDDVDGICQPCKKEIDGGGNPARWVRGCTRKPKGGCFHYMQLGKALCGTCQGHPKADTEERPKEEKAVSADELMGHAPKKDVKFTKKCIGKQCNNDLPEGRKSWCFSCRPREAKEVVM